MINERAPQQVRVLEYLKHISNQITPRSNVMPNLPPSLFQQLWKECLKEHGDNQVEDIPPVKATNIELACFNLDVALIFVGEEARFVTDYFYDRGLKHLGPTLFCSEITDNLTACCFSMIGFYYTRQGGNVARDIIMQKVWKYIHHTDENLSSLSTIERAKHSYLVHNCFFRTMNINLVDCHMWVKIYLIVSYMDFSYHYPDTTFDSDYIEFIQKIDSDVMNYTHTLHISLDSTSKFIDFFDNNERTYIAHLLKLAIHGYRIDILLKTDSCVDDRVKESADYILSSDMLKIITKTSIETQPVLWKPIESAAKAHLALFEEADNHQLRSEVFSKLISEQKLIKTISMNYNANVSDIINQLSKAIDSYEFQEDFSTAKEDCTQNHFFDIVARFGLETKPKKLTKREVENYLDVLFS
ncbi:dcm [Acrasis kona]|uniref:Dcm n=1 Tax=Acrasis kona TaxID=1008807 RepID=A0AAW2YNF8_9EUKA